MTASPRLAVTSTRATSSNPASALPTQFLFVGTLTRPHGILGEVKVQVSREFLHALDDTKRVYLRLPSAEAPIPYKIRGHRIHQESVLLKFVKVVTRNDSEALRGAEVLIDPADLPALPPGEYYSFQLVGLKVQHEDGTALGQVEDVLATGSNDVYVVRKLDGKELLLPAISSVIRNIDLEAQTMTAVIPAGLEDGDVKSAAQGAEKNKKS